MSSKSHAKAKRHARSSQRRASSARADNQIGATFEVRIERILPGGLGIAHNAAGRTLLVRLAAPDDVVRVRVDDVRGQTLFASIIEVLEPSSQRAVPPCRYFGRCGGCDFQQLSYQAQLDAKVGIIEDCLRRIGRLETMPEIMLTPSPSPLEYRLRAEWQYDAREGKLGYYEANSHRICDAEECPKLVPELQRALSEARASDVMREDGSGELRAMSGDEGAIVVSINKAETTSELATSRHQELTRTVGAETYRFDADCFFQVNHALLLPLIEEALRQTELDNNQLALDLYCGVGLFTVPLARRFRRVTGVESNQTAARHANINLRAANLHGAKIECADVALWLQSNAQMLEDVGFVLLDPPRAGVDATTIKILLRLLPRRIVYVSCDPATLARDVRLLRDGGYELERVMAFDMFPQTHHVETVAHLIAR